MADNKKEQLSEGALNKITGGYEQAMAPCLCETCGNWIMPEPRGINYFCPVCGRQVGGVMK